MIGTTLGRYHLTAMLGAGGMGEVYRARDEQLDRDVAIKVLSRDSTIDAAGLRVDGVLLGSVARVGDRVRIMTQLIDPSTDEHLRLAAPRHRGEGSRSR